MRGSVFFIALCVGLTLGALVAAPAGSIGFLDEWDNAGNGGFAFPVGVAVDGSGHVYVADSEKNRVQKFDESGKLLDEWGEFGSGPGQFQSPEGVAVDDSGDVYVVDLGNARVEKFDPSGSFLSEWGSEGGGPGQLRAPEGIAVDGAGNVFVVDAINDRVTKYTSTGTFLTEWGGLTLPNGVATDSSGNVYVANSEGGNVEKFSGDGGLLAEWGAKELKFPIGIATNPAGEVFVSDTGPDTVQAYTSSGKFLFGFGGSGEGPGQLSSPVALAVAPSGKIFVADAANTRIEVFGELPAPEYGKTVNVSVVSGKVLVKLPGSSKYIELAGEMQIPLGAILDTSNGRVRLTAAKGPSGGEQTADFFDGLFRVLQTTHGKPITVMKLIASLHCGKGGKGHRPAASLSRRHGHGLWGSGKGNFRSEGRHGSATVRGTIWWAQDGCDGTKFKVKRGVVTITDFTNHKTLKLHKGETYLAPAG
jgi:DNA-binding beta-propeller fold protein YncE